jgi:hypothetical protein
MATRSSSNKGTDRRALNVPPPARNTQDNTQAVRRIPGVTYGEQQALTEQQQAAPLPKEGTPQAQPVASRRPMPNVDVFGATQRPTEPVTAGLDFGPGVGPAQPPQQSVNDLLYQMYVMTGDIALLQLVDFD